MAIQFLRESLLYIWLFNYYENLKTLTYGYLFFREPEHIAIHIWLINVYENLKTLPYIYG